MPKSTRRNSPIRIMFVDDEKDILSTVKRGLESNNAFTVETFSSGESALQAFESHPENYYDLVITDIRMPKMNGFELYRRIKEKNQSMKIAFITAFEINKEEFNKVMPSVNVIDFISKPLSISSLITKLKSMLKNYPESPATL
ncbi:MAG: response regulator [Thermoproteota archaeon]|jgi:response regulator RpfG family c-di-GMP phosphodiesterase|nr:response regulator [Thermoproteota archaeon]HYY50904.1 response regulator [Nitrososphaeraceae archaeon]